MLCQPTDSRRKRPAWSVVNDESFLSCQHPRNEHQKKNRGRSGICPWSTSVTCIVCSPSFPWYVVSKTSESSSFASKNKSLQSPVRATAQLASASKKAKNASGSSDEKKSDKTPATVDKKATQIAPADSDAIPSSSRGMLLQKFYDAEEAADNAEKKTAKHLKNKKVSPPVKPAPKSPSSDSSKSSSEIESSSESESASDSDSSSESSGNFSA